MKLRIFTTSRQVREFLKNKNNELLDKIYTLGEFLEKIVVVDGKKFIDKDLRKKYLYEAIKNVDVEKLGIAKEFINFFEDSDFIFSFFNELFLERVDIDKVILSDVYLDYEEHLMILREIRENYKKLLEENGYIDKFLIDDFKINNGLLDGVEQIEIKLEGYLSCFDLEVLEKIDKPIFINFDVDGFNKNLLEKSFKIGVEEGKSYLYDFKNNKLKEIKKEEKKPQVSVEYFSERISQVDFVFAKIAQFVDEGIDPEKIAVVLPDESFSEFLKLFDEYENLNFAMGESFTNSDIYIKLKAIYEYLLGDEKAYKKCEDVYEEFEKSELIEFIRSHSSSDELKVIDEELYKLEAFKDIFDNKKDFLYFVLERFKNKSFDDVYSGKITCMGVLESRGMEFDGVILVDFNDESVPNVGESDLFLNTYIRKLSSLPTRQDKENLQKHYYFQLVKNAKKVAISYVKNEEKAPSRFLYELNLPLGENVDEKYKNTAIKFSSKKEITEYDDNFEVKFPLFPTTLKTLLECPKKYYFSKILEITNEEEDEEEFFGNIFHDSIKDIISNKFSSSDEYYEALIRAITSKISDKELLFEVLVKWDDKIRKFCETDYKNIKNARILPEETIRFYYEGVELAARVDRIDIKDDEVVLIDYKTSKNALKNEKYPYEFQTTFYYLWAKEKFPDKNIRTVIWDLYEGQMIEGIIKEDILKNVLKKLPNKVKEAEDIIFEIDDKEFVKKRNDICKYCEYQIACGRDL